MRPAWMLKCRGRMMTGNPKTLRAIILVCAISWSGIDPVVSRAGDACYKRTQAVSSAEGPEIHTDPVPANAEPMTDEISVRNHGSDLVVSRRMASSYVYTEWRYFYSSSCSYREGCIETPGWRRLLRFYTRVINQGSQNFRIGDPEAPENEDNAVWDSCHGHYHLKDWASYKLLTSDGSTVVRGRKQAFCLMDSVRIFGSASRRYDCDYQGITRGWADDYPDTLPCQWIDITGVPSGTYTLQITVNPSGRYREADRTNNRVRVEVSI